MLVIIMAKSYGSLIMHLIIIIITIQTVVIYYIDHSKQLWFYYCEIVWFFSAK